MTKHELDPVILFLWVEVCQLSDYGAENLPYVKICILHVFFQLDIFIFWAFKKGMKSLGFQEYCNITE